MGAISSVVERAHLHREPAGVLIVGAPGSGKTRLLGEVVQRVRFAPAVRVVGFEPMQSIPLAAVGDLLRHLATAPEHGQRLNDLVFGDTRAAARDPVRIFEAAHRALSVLGPLLLAVDDLQWFDARSESLVHYLLGAADAAHQHLIVVACGRPGRATSAIRASLEGRLPDERRAAISLGPLSLEEGVALARAVERSLSDADAVQLWRRAHGSPFWLHALARQGGQRAAAGLIAERLGSLSGDAGELLATLAVAARPFSVSEIAHALDWPAERVLYASRDLVGAGLALEVAASLQLAHDLIRDAVVADLPIDVSRRLHAAVAKAIEAAAGADVKLLCETLEHRVAAGLPSADLALRMIAAPQRRLLSAHNLRVVASISDSIEPDATEARTLNARLGALASEIGEHEIAMERWRRVAASSPKPPEHIEAEVEAARAAFALGRPRDAHHHLDRARSSAQVTPIAAIHIDALEADVALWLDKDLAAGNRFAHRALVAIEQIATAAGGVDRLSPAARLAYLAALESASDAALQEDRGHDALRLSEEIMAVAKAVDETSYVQATMRAAFALRPLGRIAEAETLYRAAWEQTRRQILPGEMIEAGRGLARALHDRGSLQEARAIARETVEIESRLANAPRRWGSAAPTLHMIELSLEDPRVAARALRQDAATEPDPHYRIAISETVALWEARFGGPRTAANVLEDLAAARSAAATAGCRRCSAQLSIVAVEILARIGALDQAKTALRASEVSASPNYALHEIWTLSGRAAIAIADGEHKVAIPILERLSDELGRLGMRPDLFWTRLDLGRLLANVDRKRAVEVLTGAARLAESMGAVNESRVVAHQLRRLGVRNWRRGRATAGDGLARLSERERQVAHLAADGRSNREIAEALVVSPKTVERHLTNVLAKLELRNRTELATWVSKALVRGSPDE